MRIISKINQNLDVDRLKLSKHIVKIEVLNNNNRSSDAVIKDFRTYFEVNVEVIGYYLYHLKFIIDIDNERYEYIPPIILVKYDRSLEVVDIAERNIQQDKVIRIFKEYCKNSNIGYKTYRYEEFKKSNELYNANFLFKYKRPGYGFNYDRIDVINNTLAEHEVLTIQELLDYSVKSEDNKILLLYTIWVMIARQWLEYDYSSRLSMETKVCL